MLQFYFLSIVLNALTGYLLITKSSSKNAESKKSFFEQNRFVVIVIAVLTILVGIIKIFVVAKDGVGLFGDFVPFVAGCLGGISLLLLYITEKSTVEIGLPDWLKNVFIKNSYIVGIICIAAAVLHFIAPGALFL